MRVLLATYVARDGMGDTVAAALREMATLVRTHEPGCTLYRACRSSDYPDAFVLYEEYVDDAALHAHRQTPHFKAIIEGTIAPLLERRERAFYTTIDD